MASFVAGGPEKEEVVTEARPATSFPSRSSGRAHYSVSKGGKYPAHLLNHQYFSSDFPLKAEIARANNVVWSTAKYEDYGRGEPIYSPYHVSGMLVDFVDLRYYVDLPLAFNMFKENGLAIKKLCVKGHHEVDNKLLNELSINPAFNLTLVALDISKCKNITFENDSLQFNLVNVLLNFRNLTAIAFAGIISLSDEKLSNMLAHLPFIKALDLSGCSRLTDISIKNLAKYCKNHIESLNCSRNDNYTFSGVNELLLHCEKLKHLNIADCINIQFIGVCVKASDGSVQHVSRNLYEVNYSKCIHINSTSLEWLASANSNIETLSLSHLRHLTDSMLLGFAESNGNLASINVSKCHQITKTSISQLGLKGNIAEKLINLNISHVGVVDNKAFTQLLIHCSHLKCLDVTGNKGVGDNGFADIIISTKSSNQRTGGKQRGGHSDGKIFVINRPLELEKLSLSGTSLTSFGIACMAERCPSLRYLDISYLEHVNDAAISVVSCCCTRLRDFKADHCYALTDQSIVQLCYSCRYLEVVSLASGKRYTDAWGTRFTQYTDDVVVAAFEGLYNLREIHLHNQFGIHFANSWLLNKFRRTGHNRIRVIDMRGVEEISMEHISLIFSRCTELNDVYMSGPEAISWVQSQEFIDKAFKFSVYANVFGYNYTDSHFENVGDDESLDDLSLNQSLNTVSLLDNATPTIVSSAVSAFTSQTSLIKQQKSKLEKEELIRRNKSAGDNYPTNPSKTGELIAGDEPSTFKPLSPHSLASVWRFRDQYIRRRLRENRAASVIGFKFLLHRMWMKLRRGISVRKIQRWYIRRKEEIRFQVKLLAFIQHRSARLIQRRYRDVLLPMMMAAMKIQGIFRRWVFFKRVLFRASRVEAAVKIQKIARGMMARLSDKFILAQLFLKLPPFWRAIMKSAPPPLPVGQRYRKEKKTIFPYQIEDSLGQTKVMLDHILTEVAHDGVLQPKLPFVVPQPFDKSPYVSLNDGRKMTFYSHVDGLLHSDVKRSTLQAKLAHVHDLADSSLSKEDKVKALKKLVSEEIDSHQNTVHIFNMTFWPLTEPPHDTDVSTLEHDPLLNNFEVAQNYRTTLYCEVCRTRLRSINCKTCQRGYCFYCAFRSHTESTRRNHSMEVMEPRIIKIKEVSKSLVYHIDMAKKASYDLSYLVKYMRSASEVKRLQAEKQMAKQMELQEDQRRQAYLRAQNEGVHKHQAATVISLVYRVFKAKKIVREKRLNLELENVSVRFNANKGIWVPVQVRYRLYSTKKWLSDRGVKFKARTGKKKKKVVKKEEQAEVKITYEQLLMRVNFELQTRQRMNRASLFYQVYDKFSVALAHVEANISYWVNVTKNLPAQEIDLLAVRNEYNHEHEVMSQDIVALKPTVTPTEYEKLEKTLQKLLYKVETSNQRLDNCQNIKWWATQHMRSLYRRRAAMLTRIQDTFHRLEWVANESAVIDNVLFHLDIRLSKYNGLVAYKEVYEWLVRHKNHCEEHSAALDAQQETIILEELNRIDRDHHATIEFDSLIGELHISIIADSHYAGEKVALDIRALEVVPGTDEALRVSEQLLVIKRRQNQLRESVLDTLKQGLQVKFDEEDQVNTANYSFPTDDPTFTIEDMDKITCELVDPFHAHRHFKVMDFIGLYYTQPWLSVMAVADVKFEEVIKAKELELDTNTKIHTNYVNQISGSNEKMQLNKEKIQFLEQEITLREEKPEEETSEEEVIRMEVLKVMRTEVMKKEGENSALEAIIKKVEEMLPKALTLIENNRHELDLMQEKLRIRVAEREHIAGSFLGKEETFVEELFHKVAQKLADHDKQSFKAINRLKYCEIAASEAFIASKILTNSMHVDERNALFIPIGTVRYEYQDVMHKVSSRIEGPAANLLRIYAESLVLGAAIDVRYNEKVKSLLEADEHDVQDFVKKKAYYAKVTDLVTDSLLFERRQRSTQKELEERIRRVQIFRDDYARQLREANEAKAKEAAEVQEKVGKALADAAIKKKPLLKQIAQATKRTVRGLKDAIDHMNHAADVAMDKEEQRMAMRMRSKNKDTGDKPEGIRRMFMTQGEEESDAFQKQQDLLLDKGLPYYTKMDRSFGNQIFIWTEATFDPSLFVTTLELAHKVDASPLYKDLTDDGFEPITHDSTNLVVWIKRDKTKIRSIGGLAVSFSEQEEVRNSVDGFIKIEQSLSDFDLPDVFLWFKQTMKLQTGTASADTNTLINEVLKSRELLKKKPDDKNLQALIRRQNDALETAYKKQQEHEVTNPLKSAADLMALNVDEMQKWMQIFERFDAKRSGFLTVDEIFIELEETPTSYTRYVFGHVDAFNSNQKIEFGDFMRSIATYCLFGKMELCKFLFTFADRETKQGTITHEQFVQLLNTMHPYDKKRAKRALKELNMISGKVMKFDEFYAINDMFPAMFFPAFRLQDSMRKKTMGNDWFVDKLNKYKQVRKKMSAVGTKVDEMAELEMKRFVEDQAREKRMVQRDIDIKNETSTIRKVMLEAKQFLDEVS